MKPRLLWKLIGIQIPTIAGVIVLMWIAIDYLAADYFMSLMKQYQIDPGETHGMFLTAVHRYLLWASAIGLVVASALSYALTRRALDPLTQMIEVAGAISHGDYSARVSVRSSDEIGRLAEAFNRMADNLERIERMRRALISDAAHELRTPLTNIRGYLEALKDGVVKPDRDRLEMLHEEALRLTRITDSLFELARADADALVLELESVPLGPAIDETLQLFSSQIAERGLQVCRDIGPGADVAPADPDRLRQVLRNLCENAVRYADEGGWVQVRTFRTGDGAVRIEFSNSGEVISSEDLPLIFERFYRGEKSRSRDRGGAGIGLAIVKELVWAHGGRVDADSTSEGTRIWFELPARSLTNP